MIHSFYTEEKNSEQIRILDISYETLHSKAFYIIYK